MMFESDGEDGKNHHDRDSQNLDIEVDNKYKGSQETRIVYASSREVNRLLKYPSNYVRTAKYTPLTFLPKYLFQQFKRAANIYFLVISVLQLIPGLSPTGKFTTLVGLVVVLILNAAKELYEDFGRHKQDRIVNNRTVDVLDLNSQFVQRRWQDVEVGDIIRIKDNEGIPADCILLAASGRHSSCYVETSSLDGETNLKIKQALPATTHLTDDASTCDFKGIIECENRNVKLYEFSGTLKVAEGDTLQYPLCLSQLLLRGCTIRDTEWVVAVVINTGIDTKVVQNSKKPPLKRSNVERQANRQIFIVFGLLGFVSIMCATASGIWQTTHEDHWYLDLTGSPAVNAIVNVFTFIVLFYNFVPISLYISMEFVKLGQGYFINNDLNMYDANSDTPAAARTTNLNEELGQVKYIFSDKTGTLTDNLMQFRCCSIGGKLYGNFEVPVEPELQNETFVGIGGAVSSMATEKLEDPLVNFSGSQLLNDLREKRDRSRLIHEFLVTLAVCHTVVPVADKQDMNKVNYQAASPDEASLVAAAKQMGYILKDRSPENLAVVINGQMYTYKILNIIEFTSDRKRMSVIVETPDGKILLYVKGADTVLTERLAPNQIFLDQTHDHLNQFGVAGFRTLMLAYKEIEKDSYSEWAKMMYAATIAMKNREDQIAKVAELIENDLTLIGATAIEDRLQQGVPQAIKMLSKAGIKIWMLTGDKQETAINIGFSCHLLSEQMERIIVNEVTKADTKRVLSTFVQQIRDRHNSELALVIDGVTLSFALEEDIKLELLQLATKCQSVICCRVSPLQKAQVVSLVKDNLHVITLAIGDGGNDVSMIQAAHVGVGISGKEGTQASRSADYSVSQFSFLVPLLLVHGTRAYRSIARLIQYSFYKNIALVMTQFWFTILNGFSGQTLYERWTLSMFNVLFTFFPIITFGLFDRGPAKPWILNNPHLYLHTQQNHLFKKRHMFGWVMNAVYHSIIVFWMTYLIIGWDVQTNGRQAGLWLFGLISYTCVVIIVTLKLALESRYWVWLHHVAIWGSLGSWFVWEVVYAPLGLIRWSLFNGLGSETIWNFYDVATLPSFWFSILLIPLVALWRDYTWKFGKRTYRPESYHIVEEQERSELDLITRDQPNSVAYTGYAFSPGISADMMESVVLASPVRERKKWIL